MNILKSFDADLRQDILKHIRPFRSNGSSTSENLCLGVEAYLVSKYHTTAKDCSDDFMDYRSTCRLHVCPVHSDLENDRRGAWVNWFMWSNIDKFDHVPLLGPTIANRPTPPAVRLDHRKKALEDRNNAFCSNLYASFERKYGVRLYDDAVMPPIARAESDSSFPAVIPSTGRADEFSHDIDDPPSSIPSGSDYGSGTYVLSTCSDLSCICSPTIPCPKLNSTKHSEPEEFRSESVITSFVADEGIYNVECEDQPTLPENYIHSPTQSIRVKDLKTEEWTSCFYSYTILDRPITVMHTYGFDKICNAELQAYQLTQTLYQRSLDITYHWLIAWISFCMVFWRLYQVFIFDSICRL